jgi:hypothetical protein
MTELEQCKATLREDARRLCEKSKHADHPFPDCPCSVLRVIEELERELSSLTRAFELSECRNATNERLARGYHDDAARLDWLREHSLPMTKRGGWEGLLLSTDTLAALPDGRYELREAIDAAMGGESDGA